MVKPAPPPSLHRPPPDSRLAALGDLRNRLPLPTAHFRRRAWREFQRALDPLAPPRSLPPPRPR